MKTPEEIKKGLECCMHEGECKRCPYKGEKCTITASGDALAYIRQLEVAQPKWISVEEELPKKWLKNNKEQMKLKTAGEPRLLDYLIYSPKYGVSIGNYLKPAGVWLIMGKSVDVTHWMPAPDMPKVV